MPNRVVLDEDQILFVEVVRELLQEEPSRPRRPIFLTGGPGSGKTFIFQQVVTELRENAVNIYLQRMPAGSNPDQYLKIAKQMACDMYPVVTPTSFAASRLESLGARNLQHLLGTLGTKEPINAKKLSKSTKHAILTMQAMFYDEISMLHPILFRNMDLLFREVRNCPHLFMGGVAFIGAGDFFQLPPVITGTHDELKAMFPPNGVIPLLFQTDLWKKANFRTVLLGKQHRQSDDESFAALLNRIRTGTFNDADLKSLYNRVRTRDEFVRELVSRDPVQASQEYVRMVSQTEADLSDLCFKNDDVDASNRLGLASLGAQAERTFFSDLIVSEFDYMATDAICRTAEMSANFHRHQVKVSGGDLKFWTGPRNACALPSELTVWTDDANKGVTSDMFRLKSVFRAASASTSSDVSLTLKRGCKVLCTANDSRNVRIFNGLKGTVIAFMTPVEFSHMESRYLRAYSASSRKRAAGKNAASSSSSSAAPPAHYASCTSFGDPTDPDGADDAANQIMSDDALFEMVDAEEVEWRGDDHSRIPGDDDCISFSEYISHSMQLSEDECDEDSVDALEASKTVSTIQHAITRWPVVQFINGEVEIMTPQLSELDLSAYTQGKSSFAFVRSIKLKLAYAFSVHKQQGATLKSGYVVPSNWSTEAIFYVAISRFPDMKSFALRSFDANMIKVRPDVVAWYQRLRQQYEKYVFGRREAELMLQCELVAEP